MGILTKNVKLIWWYRYTYTAISSRLGANVWRVCFNSFHVLEDAMDLLYLWTLLRCHLFSRAVKTLQFFWCLNLQFVRPPYCKWMRLKTTSLLKYKPYLHKISMLISLLLTKWKLFLAFRIAISVHFTRLFI